ncbi:MAG: hypothetical protein FJY17_07080 [Bacteroidetes bacterium]|nr:hypothetical protein [Bacteroidota bacterium]
MKCTIHVYLLNELFSQKIANENFNGNESADNKKYIWEDELVISGTVLSIQERQNAVYDLRGILPNGNQFLEEVQAMRLITITSENTPDCAVGVSESILDRLEIDTKNYDSIIRFYIKDNEPLANPIPGIYIASKEFPKSLIH